MVFGVYGHSGLAARRLVVQDSWVESVSVTILNQLTEESTVRAGQEEQVKVVPVIRDPAEEEEVESQEFKVSLNQLYCCPFVNNIVFY